MNNNNLSHTLENRLLIVEALLASTQNRVERLELRAAPQEEQVTVNGPLNGQMIHSAKCALWSNAWSWDQLSEHIEQRYEEMAHILCKHMSLCEICGYQRPTNEVSGLQLCNACYTVGSTTEGDNDHARE